MNVLEAEIICFPNAALLYVDNNLKPIHYVIKRHIVM